MEPVSTQIVVGMGELLWDCFADSRRPGGAPANVAFHAQQLGHRGVVCSRVGDDELGRELLDHLRDHGLAIELVQRDSEHATGYVTVKTADPANPEYVIHENVAWDFLEFDDELERIMESASAVCFGTLAQRNARSRETIHWGLSAARDALIVYDVNLRQSWYERDWIERSLRASHIVKLNGDELVVLSVLLRTGPPDPAVFAAALRERYDIETVCVTRAEHGCLVISRDATADVPGAKVTVADTVGAGDAFTAALISASLRQWPLDTAAAFANAVGGLVAGRAGAMPALAVQYAELVAEAEP